MPKQYIVCKLFNQFCMFDLDMVIEVVNVTTMIRTKAKELNVMIWRNHSIPVVDPTAMMSKVYNGRDLTTKSKLLVIKPREEMREIAVLVDAVIGIEEIQENEMQEASINDARYICGRVQRKTYQLKLLNMDEFLKGNIVEKFSVIYGMRSEELEKGVKVFGKQAKDKEEVVDTMRLKAINWLIRAIKRNIEETFIVDMKKIYDLTLKL